ncbi:MAG: ClbS/DfsB family four-helix bundle protein [Clostridia bacterium]|nr:ClbS/DfsB family four-helix bundle protein [Clostridia bacterium]
MPRPGTKADLLHDAKEEFEKLFQLIEKMPSAEQNATFDFGADPGKEAHWKRDKNVRDVLVHLYEWHKLLLDWVDSNQKGIAKTFIPEPYNWKTYGDMNVEIWKEHQSTSLEEAIKMLRESHQEIMTLMEQFSNDELFTKKHFSWTGTSNLGSYFVSTTSSHYAWAIKKIRKHTVTYAKHA